MIIERWTWTVHYSHKSEFTGLVKEHVAQIGFTPRICSTRFGTTDRVSWDLEFESFLAREEFWESFDYDRPGWNERHDRFIALSETGTTCELLVVH
jgi:hypothetical protein